MARSLGCGCAVLLLGLMTPPARAQFSPPVQITPDASGYHSAEIIVDGADNVAFTFVKAGDVFYTNSGSASGQIVNVTANPLPNDHARIAPGPLLSVLIAYEEESPIPGAGNEIFLVGNFGGLFDDPTEVTHNVFSDDRPAISVSGGHVDLAWDSSPQTGNEIRFSRDGETATLVASGRVPQLIALDRERTLVAYERNDSLLARTFDGAAFGSPFVLANLPGADVGLSLAGLGDDVVHGVFVNGGALYYVTNEGGSFGPPLLVDPGPVGGEPRVVTSASRQAVTYVSGEEVRVVERIGGSFGSSLPIAPAARAHASGAIDSLGYLHVAYEDAGAILYTTNIPAPTADFSASPLSGGLPLTVTFTNQSTGVAPQFDWDFGDGFTSTAVNPVHTYETLGPHSVTLTATGPGGSDTKTRFDYVKGRIPPNAVTAPSIRVFGGQPSIQHPIRAYHTDALQGFQLAMVYDEGVTPISEVSFGGTAVGALDPDFVHIEVTPDGQNSTLIVAIIFDTSKPFDGDTIPPGSQNLAVLKYDVPFNLPFGTSGELRFVNALGDPPISNIFSTDAGLTVSPFLLHGRVTIDAIPGFLFTRGDVNTDQVHGLPDPLYLLTFIFLNGPPPACPDAADFNDDGNLTIIDAIDNLNFLFIGAKPPAYPYPGFGSDPTADDLAPCLP